MINKTVLKQLLDQVYMQALVSSTRCLLEALQRALQLTHQQFLPVESADIILPHVVTMLTWHADVVDKVTCQDQVTCQDKVTSS